MDQEIAQRFAGLEAAVVQLNEQHGRMAGVISNFANANHSSFQQLLLKEHMTNGMQAVQRTITDGLLANADQATRRNVEAGLQVAYEAFVAQGSDPAFLEQFVIAARSVLPDIELSPAAE
ncbi:hypothetical protein E4417_16455 [Stenotrophomonas maltophilia]|uniref:hypothetical protein n=1 Tax=Stenotrophomonas maltophilia TaxID=40324 RepID=UPI0010949B68|nr:hypothetical protein [Stenotrophomonas maltophilia]TGW16818.1 hypothetical protein E4417_16455 [Stenotrophomonas maltophilia]